LYGENFKQTCLFIRSSRIRSIISQLMCSQYHIIFRNIYQSLAISSQSFANCSELWAGNSCPFFGYLQGLNKCLCILQTIQIHVYKKQLHFHEHFQEFCVFLWLPPTPTSQKFTAPWQHKQTR
jgi:hypothetical protein